MFGDVSWGFGWHSLGVCALFIIGVAIPLLIRRWRRIYVLSIALLGIVTLTFLWIRDLHMSDSLFLSTWYERDPRLSRLNRPLAISAPPYEVCSLLLQSARGGISIFLRRDWHDDPIEDFKGRLPRSDLVYARWGWNFSGNRNPELPLYPNTSTQYQFLDRCGFRASWHVGTRMDPRSSLNLAEVVVPTWFPIACLATIPLWPLVRQKSRRRKYARQHGLCENTKCFFNLRGTPANADGTRTCGECGHVNPPAPTQKSESVEATTTDPRKKCG